MDNSDLKKVRPKDEFVKVVCAMIEDLEKINLLYPRPVIIESIEDYRGFITGRFRL